tara:strand:- start:259 stop:501 length:243 start_codon:yes stop_codon:yes gene_type:complete
MSFSNIKLVRDVLPRIIIQKGNQINNLNNIPNDKNKIFYYTYLNYGNMNVSELKNNFENYGFNQFEEKEINMLKNYIFNF